MSEIRFRAATASDLSAIIALLADDPLGAAREDPSDLAPYRTAFDAIVANDMHELIVADQDGAVVGCCQLTVLHNLTRHGATRALLEGIRVAASLRGQQLGERMIRYAIERARARGCTMLQLTSDKKRPDAIRFYERLGFEPSHEGLKMPL